MRKVCRKRTVRSRQTESKDRRQARDRLRGTQSPLLGPVDFWLQPGDSVLRHPQDLSSAGF